MGTKKKEKLELTMSSLFGKCDDEIHARIPFELKQDIVTKAHKAGINEAEYIRIVLAIHLKGKAHIRKLQQQQFDLVTKVLP